MKETSRKFRQTHVSQAVLVALCGTASLFAAPQVFAQQTGSTLQRVEVTGSNIRRTDTETPSPVQVISREEIEQSGKANVAEYLQTLTADAQGSVPFTYGRGFSGATSAGISLRGLGANATLVLINGRRAAAAVLADDAQRTYVDLNTIPLDAVERVEVLKDGASSIYGSDAVAGVVNIILRKNFQGTQIKAQYGASQKGDGDEPKISLMHGRGDMDKDGYNWLVNLDASKKDAIYYRDRAGRGMIGVTAIGNPKYNSAFDPNGTSNNLARIGGNGWIANNAAGARVNNSTTQSIIGNVRNPTTLDYYSRGETPNAANGFTRAQPGAQAFCNQMANLPQNNPMGGCVTDIWQQVGQVQPDFKNYNLFTRFSKAINAETEAAIELSYYHAESRIQNTGTTPSSAVNTPTGVPISQAATLIGATHPDNPYFGTAARISYNPSLEPGFGPLVTSSSSNTFRALASLKGRAWNWDYDTGIFFSEARQTDTAEKRVNVKVKDALLNPTAANVAAALTVPQYAALVGGSAAVGATTFWRIGENASLNSPALYNALLQNQTRDGYSRMYGIDGKITREFGMLGGGPIGVAVGAEFRHEASNLPFYTGLGDYIGLALTKYGGERDIWAVFTEGNFPVTKRIELNAALRYDHYSDAGSSLTPKVGGKFKALDNLALRATYARGFRAPSFTENGTQSIAAFGGATINDNARCAGTGVPSSNCLGVAPTFVQQGNPSLQSEKSTNWTIGTVWDVTPKSSVTLDYWQIKRSGLPVIEDPQQAIDRGQLTRDPSTKVTAADPGGILVGFVRFQNSAESLTRGIDLDAKHRWDLGSGWGRLTFGATWTHLLNQRVTEANGIQHEYAGTHGDCHITNCIGSPKDRIQFSTSWDMGRWRLGGVVNYRGSFSGKDEVFVTDPTTRVRTTAPCWSAAIANGASLPAGCKVSSFWTLDISGNYKINDRFEIYGSIQNLTDKKPPYDPETYGALGYNPLDYSGAIGRFFRIGVKAKF